MKPREIIILMLILIFASAAIAATTIRIKRGPTTRLPTKAPYGEMYQTKDTGKVFIGNSTAMLEWRQRGYSGARGVIGFSGEKAAPPLFCALSSGTTVVTYNEQGITPVPSPIKAFHVKLWQGSAALSTTKTSGTTAGVRRFLWNTGAIITGRKSQVYGSSTSAKFAPSVLDTYSASRGHGVLYVLVVYSTASIVANQVSGKRVCVTGVPIVSNKVGTTGGTGATGPPGLSTRKVVFDLMTTGDSASNSTWQYTPLDNYSTTWQMAFRDKDKAVRNAIGATGYQEFRSANGNEITRIMTDGTIMLFKNQVLRLHIKNDGSMKSYRNGVEVFELLSSGKWKGKEGWPTAAQVSAKKTFLYTDQYGFRKYTTGGSGDGGGAGMSNPYAIPGASQTFTSAAGRVRFTFYSARGLVIH